MKYIKYNAFCKFENVRNDGHKPINTVVDKGWVTCGTQTQVSREDGKLDCIYLYWRKAYII